MTVGLIELEPGSTVPEHAHDNEQVGMLITGSLDFRVGAETRQLEPGGIWCIPSRVPHTVSAGPKGAVMVEVFSEMVRPSVPPSMSKSCTFAEPVVEVLAI